MRNKQGLIIQEKTSYILDVEKFLKEINVKCKITLIDFVYKWENHRNKYKVVLKNNENQQYTYYFYDSVKNTIDEIFPSVYDVLSCVQKYEPDAELQNFCDMFGYSIDSVSSYKEIEKIHKSCIKEFKGIKKIFKNNLDKLAELAELAE